MYSFIRCKIWRVLGPASPRLRCGVLSELHWHVRKDRIDFEQVALLDANAYILNVDSIALVQTEFRCKFLVQFGNLGKAYTSDKVLGMTQNFGFIDPSVCVVGQKGLVGGLSTGCQYHVATPYFREGGF